MKRALYLLVLGTILSGVAAFTAGSASSAADSRAAAAVAAH